VPRPPKPVLLATALAFVLLAPPVAADAQTHVRELAATGRDVSFPQCGARLPAAAFGVVGTNGGTVFTKNPCLVDQLRWAKRRPAPPAFYANTGNPGPARSRHWPLGQTSPRRCSRAGPNSLGCSFDYGWNAARASFTAATDAVQQLHDVSRPRARQRAANVDWWLDVEILNTWQVTESRATTAAQQRNTEALAGAVNALWALGVDRVGFYATRYQWNLVTGGLAVTGARFSRNPVWFAGFSRHAAATAACGRASFTGGPVLMTQYLAADGFDADVWCA